MSGIQKITEETAVFPVASWHTRPIQSHGIILFKLYYLTSPMQLISEALPSRFVALTKAQARHLISDLQKAIDKIEDAELPYAEGPLH